MSANPSPATAEHLGTAVAVLCTDIMSGVLPQEQAAKVVHTVDLQYSAENGYVSLFL